MSRQNEAATEFWKQMLADVEPDLLEAPLDMDEVKRDVEEWQAQYPHCISGLTLFEDAPRDGWTDAWHVAGHAANCPQCRSAALVALRNRAPGLWVVWPVERDTTARPLWWTSAVDAYLEEAPRTIRVLAATLVRAEQMRREFQAAASKVADPSQARSKGQEDDLLELRDYHAEDKLLSVVFREVKDAPPEKKYVLTVRDMNLRAARAGRVVQTGLIGEQGRLDCTLRLRKARLGWEAEVPIGEEAVAEIDVGMRARGKAAVALLPLLLLDEEEATGIVADNDPEAEAGR